MHTYGHKIRESENIKIIQFDYMSIKSTCKVKWWEWNKKDWNSWEWWTPFCGRRVAPLHISGAAHTAALFAPVPCSAVELCPTLWNPVDCSPPGSSVHRTVRGKNTGMGSHFLLQGIFLTQGSNPRLLNLLPCSHPQASLPTEPLGKPCLPPVSWQILGWNVVIATQVLEGIGRWACQEIDLARDT